MIPAHVPQQPPLNFDYMHNVVADIGNTYGGAAAGGTAGGTAGGAARGAGNQ